jgi:hypothetical protein
LLSEKQENYLHSEANIERLKRIGKIVEHKTIKPNLIPTKSLLYVIGVIFGDGYLTTTANLKGGDSLWFSSALM